MKEAIEKAIGNGLFKEEFDSIDVVNIEYRKYYFEFEGRYRDRCYHEGVFDNREMGYYRLIFDPSFRFIECLVGEGGVKWICSGCGGAYSQDSRGKYCPSCNNSSVPLISRYDYHRAQMANIKTIEELKDYVRGLVK